MSNPISWNSLGQSGNRSGNKINNLRLETGTHQVRFIGEPIEFYKYFVNGKSAVTANPKTCPIRLKYNIEPSTRYAINVIDRKDGQLKVLECPITVLKPVVTWSQVSKRDPGGDNSVDFAITVSGQGKHRRYIPVALGDSPLTPAEKEMIKATGGTEHGYDLVKLYKPVPEDEIEARLFGGGVSAKAVQKEQSPTTVGQTTTNVDIAF